MKTIKVIDLLNKIANGEEVPKHIHIRDVDKYTWQEDVKAYWSDRDENNLLSDLDLSSTNLKEDIEIIEEPRDIEVCGSLFTKSEYDELAKSNEDKKIEKMEFCYKVADEMQNANNERFRYFINEIIDRLNGEDNE